MGKSKKIVKKETAKREIEAKGGKMKTGKWDWEELVHLESLFIPMKFLVQGIFSHLQERLIFEDGDKSSLVQELKRSKKSVEGKIERICRGEDLFEKSEFDRSKQCYTKNEEYFIEKWLQAGVSYTQIGLMLGRSGSGVEAHWNEVLERRRPALPPMLLPEEEDEAEDKSWEEKEEEYERDNPAPGRTSTPLERVYLQGIRAAIKGSQREQALILLDMLEESVFEPEQE